VGRGHEVLVEASAGVGSSIPDDEYVAAGAQTWTPPTRCGRTAS
jgi:alanine dehydrogenase